MRQRKGCNWQMSDSCLSSSLSWMCKSMIWSRLIVMLKMNILLSSTQNSIQETIYRKFWPESLRQRSVVYIICSWQRLLDQNVLWIVSYTVYCQIFKGMDRPFANFCGKGFADWRFQLFAGTAHAPFASTSCSAAHFPISAFRSGVGSSCFHLLELTCFTSHAMAVEGTSFKTRPSSHSTVAKVWQYSLA